MKTGIPATFGGTEPINITGSWRVSSDNGATWTTVATGLTFSDELMATHAGKKLIFVTTGSNVAGTTPDATAPIDLPATAPLPIPAFSYTPSKTSVLTTDADGTPVGSYGAMPAGITVAQIDGTLALTTNKRDVVLGATPRVAGTPTTITVRATGDAGGPYAGATARTDTRSVSVTAPVVQTPTYSYPLQGRTSPGPAVSPQPLLPSVDVPMVFTRDSASGTVRNIKADPLNRPSSSDLAWINGGTTRMTGFARQDLAGAPITTIPWSQAPLVQIDTDGTLLFVADSNDVWFSLGAGSIQPNMLGHAMITATVNLPADTAYGHLFSIAKDDASWDTDSRASEGDNGWLIAEVGGTFITTKRGFGEVVDSHFDIPRAQTVVMQIGCANVDRAAYYARANGASLTLEKWGANDDYGHVQNDASCTFFVFGNPNGRRCQGMAFKEFYFTGDETQSGIVDAWATAAMITAGIMSPAGGGTGGSGAVGTPSAAVATFNAADWAEPTVGSGVSGVRFAAPVSKRAATGDVVGFNFKGSDRGATGARQWFFAHAFNPGEISASKVYDVVRGGQAYPASVSVHSTHPDGSPRHASIGTACPALAQSQRIPAMLRESTRTPGAAPTLPGAKIGLFTGTITVMGQTFDISAATMFNSHKVDEAPWVVGENFIECRCQYYLGKAWRVVMDYRLFSDGEIYVRFQFLADVCVWTGDWESSWPVVVNIKQNGVDCYNASETVYQGRGFTKTLYSGNSAAQNIVNDPIRPYIEFDSAYMVRSGFIPPINLSRGLYESKITYYRNQMDGASWFRQPQSGNFIRTSDMGGPGATDRLDIAPVPGWHSNFFMAPDEVFHRHITAQGETILALPINLHMLEKGQPWNFFPSIGYPNSWPDYRLSPGNGQPSNFHLTDPANGNDYDGAHQPNLCYIPFLILGERFYWDGLLTQGTFAMVSVAPYQRAQTLAGVTNDWGVVSTNQVRGTGWGMRDIARCSQLCPDRSPFRGPISQLIQRNYKWLLQENPVWKVRQGEHYGWLAHSHPDIPNDLKAWMQDHWMEGTFCAWMQGCAEAGEYVDLYLSNFVLGRDQRANGRNLSEGSCFSWKVSDLQNLPADFTPKTWAGLFNALASGDPFVNGWEQTNVYGLWRRALTEVYIITKKTAALGTISALETNNANNFITDDAYRNEGFDDLKPLPLAA